MLRASGIFLLVVFYCICGKAQDLQPEARKRGAGSIETQPNFTEIKALQEALKDRPLDLNQKVLEIVMESGLKPETAKAIALGGQTYFEQGDFENALQYLRFYRTLSTELGDSVLLVDAFCLLGKLYWHQELEGMAEEQYLQALHIAKLTQDKVLLSKCNSLLGNLYFEQKKYAFAERYFFKSLSQLSLKEQKEEYALALYNMGMVLKAREQYRQSLDYLKEALVLLHDYPDKGIVCSSIRNMGEIYQIFNDYDLAETNYLKALQLARSIRALDKMAESYKALASLYADKEQYELAYQNQSLLLAYKDTLVQLDQRASQAEVNKKMELERRERIMNQLIKEKELELLSREYKISKAEISRKNEMIYMIGAFALLLSLLVFVFYQGYMLKRRKTLQLELKNRQASALNTELQQLNNRLQQSERKLKELNDTKNKFFSIISHDLRAPLKTLSGFIEVMKNDIGLFSEEELNRFSLRMERSLQGVTSLLDNLFQWASAQTGLIEFSPVNIEIQRLVKENVYLLQDTAEIKGIALKYEVSPDLCLNADYQMIHLLLRNLISNAIKFTRKGGFVKVSAEQEGEWVALKVSDNGIGMTEENRLKLLNQNMVYTQRGTENEKGSGLGLLLCKEFVGMHKGRIGIESTPGKGTTFTLYLPACETAARVESGYSTSSILP